jgi:hypothetical protein
MPGGSLMSHILKLYPLGAQAIARAVEQLAAGQSLACVPQSGTSGYFSYPADADCARFLAQGGTVVDYADYAQVLCRFSSADHYPGMGCDFTR